jgi:hypothetical protein
MTNDDRMGEDELIGPGVEGGLGPADVLAGLLRAYPTLVAPFGDHLESWGDRPRGVETRLPLILGQGRLQRHVVSDAERVLGTNG